MNKKFSTLVAGVLLATSFGASAQSFLTGAGAKLESGKYYMLGTQATTAQTTAVNVLSVSGDSLLLAAPANPLTKTARELSLWQVAFTQGTNGSFTYSFVNKATGQSLSIPATGKATMGGAISSFGWAAPTDAALVDGVNGKPTGAILTSTVGTKTYVLQNVYVLKADYTAVGAGTAETFADIQALTAGTKQSQRLEVVSYNATGSAAALYPEAKAVSIPAATADYGDKLVYVAATTTAIGGTVGVDITYKAGTVFILGTDVPVSVAPATVADVALVAANAASTGNLTTEVAPLKTASFNFDGTTTSDNILSKYNFTAETVQLNVTTSGAATNNTTFIPVTLLKADTKVGNDSVYLVVDTAYWDSPKAYYKFALRPLRTITAAAGTTAAKMSPAKGITAASYLFDVTYSVTADSLIITPKYLPKVKSGNTYFEEDTTGVTGGSAAANSDALQVSLKDFGTSKEVTLLVTNKPMTGEKVTKVSLGVVSNTLTQANIASGVYFINMVQTGANVNSNNGKYKVDDLLTRGFDWAAQQAQDFKHMPSAQWVIEKNVGSKAVSIINRESGVAYKENTLFYADGTNVYTLGGDTLTLTALTESAVLTDSTLGYFSQVKDAEKAYKLNYFSGLDNSKFVMVTESGDHQIMSVDPKDGFNMFAMEATAAPAKYGADKKDIAKVLYRQNYRLYVVPTNKFIAKGDTMYVVYNQSANEYRIQKDKKENATAFYLKEYNDVEGLHYYAMVDATNTGKKVGVKDVILNLQPEALAEVRTSSFALKEADAPLYRRLGVTNANDGFTNLKTDTAKIYLTRNNERFLYENTKNNIAGDSTGVNYLGEYNDKQFTNAAAMFIDTAYVRANTNRPQYMLALRPQFGKWIPCPDDATHPDKYEYQVKGDYLVNLTDSLYGQKNQDKLFKFEEKTRLAFVPAIHHGDSLVITKSKFTGNNKQIENDKAKTFAGNDTINLSKNEWNNVTFQFRLVDNGADADFFIESNNNDGVYSYVQILNGVPVLTSNIADAERFNIGAPTKDVPTDNEGIETTEVSVIAGAGQVVINNAQGKTVAISNILGQAIANTVLTSDNATISVPAGIVVVAVEGESAVKAIVK